MNVLQDAQIAGFDVISESQVAFYLNLSENPQLYDIRAVADALAYYSNYPRVHSLQAHRKGDTLIIYVEGEVRSEAFEKYFKE